MKLTFPILIFCAFLFYSCEDNSSPSPSNNGNGGGGTTSVVTISNQLIGRWRVDSVVTTGTNGITSLNNGYNNTVFEFSSQVSYASPLSCQSDARVSLITPVLSGNPQAGVNSLWFVSDYYTGTLCSSGNTAAPIEYRYFLTFSYQPGLGYIENLTSSKLVTITSGAPSYLPTIPLGFFGERCYMTRIP